jgi:hypothetical protein
MRISPSPCVFDEFSPALQLAPPYSTWNVSARAKFPRHRSSSTCDLAHAVTRVQFLITLNVAGLLHSIDGAATGTAEVLSHSLLTLPHKGRHPLQRIGPHG